jgi:hypothetical protein
MTKTFQERRQSIENGRTEHRPKYESHNRLENCLSNIYSELGVLRELDVDDYFKEDFNTSSLLVRIQQATNLRDAHRNNLTLLDTEEDSLTAEEKNLDRLQVQALVDKMGTIVNQGVTDVAQLEDLRRQLDLAIIPRTPPAQPQRPPDPRPRKENSGGRIFQRGDPQ